MPKVTASQRLQVACRSRMYNCTGFASYEPLLMRRRETQHRNIANGGSMMSSAVTRLSGCQSRIRPSQVPRRRTGYQRSLAFQHSYILASLIAYVTTATISLVCSPVPVRERPISAHGPSYVVVEGSGIQAKCTKRNAPSAW